MSRSRIPSLGPRGEGWVVLQLAAIALVAVSGRFEASSSTTDPGLRSVLALAGWILVASGGVLIVSGVLVLRNAAAFSVLPHPIAGGELVASGPYRVIRHPVYAGLILGGLGLALQRQSVLTLVATLLLAVTLDLKRRREEVWLTGRYAGYAAYQARTKALVPFVY